MKIIIPNKIRGLLAIIAVVLFTVSTLHRTNAISIAEFLNHPLNIVFSIIIFALALYSPKTGFRGVGHSEGSDPAPGAKLNSHAGGSDDSGSFGGGDA